MNAPLYQSPKPGKFMRFFWEAAGADSFILERSTYSDHIKYACLGGIVVATGLMAGLAGGYAFYTIFEPKGSALNTEIHLPTVLMSVVFGMLWGLVIFNIDRFIVTSTGKGDGTEAITMQELKSALPRIAMGVIIAISISKPVEIRMFKSEIDAELHARQMEQQAEYKKHIEKNYGQFIQESRDKITKLEQEIQAKTVIRDNLAVRLQEEIQGKVGSGREGDGPASRQIRADFERMQGELTDLKTKNNAAIIAEQKNLSEWEAKMRKELTLGEEVAGKLDGLLERIKLAHKIAGGWISTFITLLFMAIELTPIFFKLMLVKSPYDYLEDNYKELIKAQQGIEVEYNAHPGLSGLERHTVINHMANQALLDKTTLIKAQKDLSHEIVSQWVARETANIRKNLGHYVTTEPEEEKKSDTNNEAGA